MAEEPTTDAPTSASGGDDEAGTAAAGAASSDAPRAAEDIEKELEELRGSLDGKDGSEKEELEEKIKVKVANAIRDINPHGPSTMRVTSA